VQHETVQTESVQNSCKQIEIVFTYSVNYFPHKHWRKYYSIHWPIVNELLSTQYSNCEVYLSVAANSH